MGSGRGGLPCLESRAHKIKLGLAIRRATFVG
jgi:hypothetical protein